MGQRSRNAVLRWQVGVTDWSFETIALVYGHNAGMMRFASDWQDPFLRFERILCLNLELSDMLAPVAPKMFSMSRAREHGARNDL
jgi:hypothetical protein